MPTHPTHPAEYDPMTNDIAADGGKGSGAGRDFNVFMKAGPLRNGAERGHGKIFHAVEGEANCGAPALCGDRPAIQWSSWTPKGQQITCPRCLKKLARLSQSTPTPNADHSTRLSHE